jgi:hypothetical protein
VDLVHEQHVARLQVGEDGGEVPGALQHRAGGGAEAHAQLARDDLRQRGLAQAGRAVQQHVVQRLAARARGLDEDGQVLAQQLLAGEVVQALRAQADLAGILVLAFAAGQAFAHAGLRRRSGRLTARSPGSPGDESAKARLRRAGHGRGRRRAPPRGA